MVMLNTAKVVETGKMFPCSLVLSLLQTITSPLLVTRVTVGKKVTVLRVEEGYRCIQDNGKVVESM